MINRITLFSIYASIATLLGCGEQLGDKELSDIGMRGDEPRALNECRKITGDNIIYRTAAKFSIAEPKWSSRSPAEKHYNSNCELERIILNFAWIDEKLIPIPRSDIKPPKSVKLPDHYESFTLMMTFRDPANGTSSYEKSHCKNKSPVYEYPDFSVIMCPYLMGAKKSPNITTLPFFPRFEIVDGRLYPTSFTCSHDYYDGYTVEDIHEMEIKYSCRGHWPWRPGAGAMFDINKGKVIQKASKVIKEVEKVLDSWVIEET